MSDHPSNVSPSAFLTLSVSYSSQRPRGFISFHSHVQDSHSRGFSRRSASLVSSTSRALLSLAKFSSQLQVAPALLPDPSAPPSGLCSEWRFVVAHRRFRPANYSIPSYAFNPFGFSFQHLRDAIATPPPMTLAVVRSLYTRQLAFSVSIGARPDALSPGHLPIRAF